MAERKRDIDALRQPDKKVRTSSVEIDEAIYQLQTAFSDGRLDEIDFDERIKKALNAKTREDLDRLLLDLPTALENRSPVSRPISTRLTHNAIAVFSGIEQKGDFILPKAYRITAVMGGCLLDLRHARLEARVSEIRITAIMGGVQILVPRGIRVQIQGLPIFGGISNHVSADDYDDDAPTIRIQSLAIFGGIEIKTIG